MVNFENQNILKTIKDMSFLRLICFFVSYVALAGSAVALEAGVYSTDNFNQTFIYPNIPQFSPPPNGGLAWDVFTTTTENFTYGTGAQKDFILASYPKFSSDIEAYDGKEILMRGYMFPLQDNEQQERFLFGPFPMTCPFHYHVPTTLVIEAFVKEPVPFTYDPIIVRGRLELVGNLGHEPYYRMHDSTIETSESLVREDNEPSMEKSFHPLFHASPMEIKKRGLITPDAPSTGDYTVQ